MHLDTRAEQGLSTPLNIHQLVVCQTNAPCQVSLLSVAELVYPSEVNGVAEAVLHVSYCIAGLTLLGDIGEDHLAGEREKHLIEVLNGSIRIEVDLHIDRIVVIQLSVGNVRLPHHVAHLRHLDARALERCADARVVCVGKPRVLPAGVLHQLNGQVVRVLVNVLYLLEESREVHLSHTQPSGRHSRVNGRYDEVGRRVLASGWSYE